MNKITKAISLTLLSVASPLFAAQITLTAANIEQNIPQLRVDSNDDYIVEGVIDVSRFGPIESWKARSFTFKSGARIKIGAMKLAVSADEIQTEGDGSPLIFYAFDSKEIPAKKHGSGHGDHGVTQGGSGRNGATGGHGGHGQVGTAGKNAGDLFIRITDSDHIPTFSVDLNGQDGGAGGDGGNGGNGGNGNRGRNAVDGPFSCRSGGGRGGNGGAGGNGGNSGPGGKPGDGGTLAILAIQSNVSLVGDLSKRGLPGIVGQPGTAGGWGGGGHGSNYCGGGSGGSRGAGGSVGQIPPPRYAEFGQAPQSAF